MWRHVYRKDEREGTSRGQNARFLVRSAVNVGQVPFACHRYLILVGIEE
jgi:hypothetical protein